MFRNLESEMDGQIDKQKDGQTMPFYVLPYIYWWGTVILLKWKIEYRGMLIM